MTWMFQHLVDTLGDPTRDIEAWYAGLGIPQAGSDELLCIPAPCAKAIAGLFEINRKLKPNRPYDVPLLPFNQRVSLKFMMEYDVDFSRATIDGRLSEGFDPEDALRRVRCPMLLMVASHSRDPSWGLLGAMDDADVERIRSMVKYLRVAQAGSHHEIHMTEPQWWLRQVASFVQSKEEER